MQRCLELALKGAGLVAPNPMVGAVLVYEGNIIGEGYHQQIGGPHAEVNCINSVASENLSLISSATLYVSLEPCAHFGKTPPCTNLIIEKCIRKVVIGCLDPYQEVNGKGVMLLQNAGIEVVTGVLEMACRNLNRRFFTYHTRKRPFIILKWARTADGFMASDKTERLLITHPFTNRLVHQWRSEEASLLIGTNTVLKDNPSLDNRLWSGKSPVRMILDLNLRLPDTLTIFDKKQPTVIFNHLEEGEKNQIRYFRLEKGEDVVNCMVKACYQMQLQSVLVEGGAMLLQSFLASGIWDETRIITNNSMTVLNGLPAPECKHGLLFHTENCETDSINFFSNPTVNQ